MGRLFVCSTASPPSVSYTFLGGILAAMCLTISPGMPDPFEGTPSDHVHIEIIRQVLYFRLGPVD